MSGMVESCYFNLEIFCSNGIIESLTNNRHNHNLLYADSPWDPRRSIIGCDSSECPCYGMPLLWNAPVMEWSFYGMPLLWASPKVMTPLNWFTSESGSWSKLFTSETNFLKKIVHLIKQFLIKIVYLRIFPSWISEVSPISFSFSGKFLTKKYKDQY